MSADPTAEHIDAAPAFSKFLTERLEDPAVRAAYEASKARDQVPLTTQAPAPVDSDYDRARYALSALRTEAGFVLGDVIARLVLDSGAVTPSTDPAALAASLPAEAMLAALVDRGALTEETEDIIGFHDETCPDPCPFGKRRRLATTWTPWEVAE